MIKDFLEAWLDLPLREALVELIGGMLYLSTSIIVIIFLMCIC